MLTRLLAGATAATCWIGLGIQFVIIWRTTAAPGAVGEIEHPALAAIVLLLLFLTMQINLAVAVATTMTAAGVRRFERAGRLRGALLAYLWAASIVFILVLQPVWNHHGTQVVVDVLLHYVSPLLYTAYWLVVVPKSALRWRDPLIWLIYPVIYLAAMLLIARGSGFHPYPITDLRFLATASLTSNIVAVTVTFLCLGLAVVAAARAMEASKH